MQTEDPIKELRRGSIKTVNKGWERIKETNWKRREDKK